MGLDIAVYTNTKLVNEDDVERDEYDDPIGNYVKVYKNEHFLHHASDLEDGAYYSYTDSEWGFVMGYGNYSAFRDELARIAGYEPLKDSEIDPDDWRAGQFRYADRVSTIVCSNETNNNYGGILSELIHFTDCDGVIGPTVSKKIYNDLKSVADKRYKLPDHYQSKFDDILRTFRLASEGEGGIVVFG